MRLGRTRRPLRAHRSGRRAIAVRALLALLAAMLVLALLPAGTSVAEEHEGTEEPVEEEPAEVEEPEEADESDIVQLDHTIPIPEDARGGNAGMSMWTLPEWRMGFLLGEPIGGDTDEGYEALIAVDLDTGDEVGRVHLDPPAWSGGDPNDNGFASYIGAGEPHTVAIDREGGRIFVAYGIPAYTVNGIGADTRHVDRAVEEQELCPSGNAFFAFHYDYLAGCLRGIHVIDAASLEIVDSIPIDGGRADAYPTDVMTGLHAMAYAPPRKQGDNGKLHLLVEEYVHHTYVNNFFQGPFRHRTHGTRAVWALQVDVDAAVVDWGVQVRDCRNARAQTEDFGVRSNYVGMPYENQIMRGADPEDPAVWVACQGRNRQAVLVRFPLRPDGFPELTPVRSDAATRIVGKLVGGGEPPGADDALAPRTAVFPGPPQTLQFLAEPESGRILMKSMVSGEVWWVFDTDREAYVGTIGISPHYGNMDTRSGVDLFTGRLYVLGPTRNTAGGLYSAEARHTPVPQALRSPDLADVLGSGKNGVFPLSVEPGDEDRYPRLYVHKGDHFVVLEDQRPPGEAPSVEVGGKTLDMDEQEGVTDRNVDGTAQGFGARAILVGGLEAAARVGPVDPGIHYNMYVVTEPIDPHDCSQRNRDVTVGFVGPGGPVTVDDGGSAAAAVPLMVDAGTRTDPSQPFTRCTVKSSYTGDVDTSDWHNLWRSTGLVGQPPVPEPGVDWPFGDGSTSCVSSDEDPAERSEGGPNGEWESEVDCGGDGADGFSRASIAGGDGVVVADVWSTFEIYLDPERGLVSRMASMARGVTLSRPDGEAAVRIDTVKAVAESWANGRAQPAEVLADEQDADYDPNCDLRRTAGTCFERHLLGVQIIDDEGEERYSCGPCGDEEAFIDGMNSALGDNVTVRLRDPDPLYARGAANGSQAAVQKPEDVASTDAKLNHDLLGNVVPALEVIRHAPYNRVQITSSLPGQPPLRGHQLYQLAGVHAGSSYEIQCLLVIHPDGSCGPPAAKPGTVTVTLEDPDGEPLAGGLFEVYADPTGDGLLGLDDPLTGTCVTDTDGSCSIEDLQPGSYVVHQSAAPAGYAPGGEVPVTIADGESWTVQFVNISQLANIEIALVDADDQRPLEGGVFEAWVDDGDGVVGAADVRTASCTTDAEGSCVMSGVPLGPFVVSQSAAPRMYTPAEPVAFALAEPGQTARVSVTNASAATEASPPPDDGAPPADNDVAPAPPVQGSTDPVGTSLPQQEVVIPNITVPAPNVSVSVNTPPAPPAPVVAPAAPAPSPVQQIVALPRDAWDFAAREPVQAAAYGGIWLLMAAAGGAVWRRRAVAQLLATT